MPKVNVKCKDFYWDGIADIMHSTRSFDFFCNLMNAAKKSQLDPSIDTEIANRQFAFAFGFYCHVITDCIFHPYVYRSSEDHWSAKAGEFKDNPLEAIREYQHKYQEFLIDKGTCETFNLKFNRISWSCPDANNSELLDMNIAKIFNDTSKVETYTATVSGIYLLEVYGAQGGNVTYNTTKHTGGNGGYSKGTIELKKGDILYIHIGSKGADKTVNNTNTTVENVTAGVGGASYISNVQNSTLTSNSSGVLIVANGGGGATSTANGTANGGEKLGNNATGYVGSLGNSETKSNARSGNGFAKISFYK